MIWLGRLGALLPEARRVAIDPQTSTYTRIAAFRTIRAIGQPGDQAEIREAFLAEAPRLKREWLEELLRDLGAIAPTTACFFNASFSTKGRRQVYGSAALCSTTPSHSDT